MSILGLVWLTDCVRGEISGGQPPKDFSIGKSKFLTNESKQFEVERKQREKPARESPDASLNGCEDCSSGFSSGSYWTHPAGSKGGGKGVYTSEGIFRENVSV